MLFWLLPDRYPPCAPRLQVLFKVALTKTGEVWDAGVSSSNLDVAWPDFGYNGTLGDKNNALVLLLEYYHANDSERLYAAVNIKPMVPGPDGVDVLGDDFVAHFMWRMDPVSRAGKRVGLRTRVAQGYKFDNTWKCPPARENSDGVLPMKANEQFWLRIVFVR